MNAKNKRLDALRRVADFLAARTGKFFSEDELGTVCGLSRPVAQNYLGVLETLYLCPFTGIVLHTGPSTARFGDGLFAVPMASFFDT